MISSDVIPFLDSVVSGAAVVVFDLSGVVCSRKWNLISMMAIRTLPDALGHTDSPRLSAFAEVLFGD